MLTESLEPEVPRLHYLAPSRLIQIDTDIPQRNELIVQSGRNMSYLYIHNIYVR